MKKNEQAQPQPDAPPPPGLTDLGWRQAALYAGAVEHYDDAVLYDYEYRRRRHDIGWYRALARQLRGRAPLRILELGCGSGRLLVPLLRDGHAVLGIDRSTAMLRRCAERMATKPCAVVHPSDAFESAGCQRGHTADRLRVRHRLTP